MHAAARFVAAASPVTPGSDARSHDARLGSDARTSDVRERRPGRARGCPSHGHQIDLSTATWGITSGEKARFFQMRPCSATSCRGYWITDKASVTP
jgi:hypothetical protein